MVSKKTPRKKKTPNRRKAGRKAPKQKLPGWIVLLGGMLIGLSLAVIGYINGWVPKPDNPNDKPIAQLEETKNNRDVEETIDLAKEPPIQQTDDFDFYQTLQDMEVVIDKDEIQQSRDREPRIYFIQLGAFRKISDAERLKAQIAFTGKTATIESVEVNQSIWHRVRIGPYTSSRKADVDKRSLENNDFKPIIVKQ